MTKILSQLPYAPKPIQPHLAKHQNAELLIAEQNVDMQQNISVLPSTRLAIGVQPFDYTCEPQFEIGQPRPREFEIYVRG